MSHDHPAAQVSQLGIKYKLKFTKKRKLRSLRPSATSRGRAPQTDRPTDFWALKDVTFSLQHGELLGVIGGNGAGKSTLMLCIAGILVPDVGQVTTFGRRVSLLTLGAGFEADLTGRDNIELNGAYLGLSRKAIRAKMDSIIEFSELGKFIDIPLRQYSTGMRSRLGFAIASHTSPDIFLLDEALSVGDTRFQEKSRARIFELMDEASAIVIVSHSMEFIGDTCNRVLWLEHGMIKGLGDPATVIAEYLSEGNGGGRTLGDPDASVEAQETATG
jgi:homopolymeric O-antigen transport system ATP-binding protein